MLQRIQTLWLFLAAACALLTLKYSFFSGNTQTSPGGPKTFEHLIATTSLLILILTIAILSATVIDIFLYKNRKMQLRIVLATLAVSLLNIFLYYKQTQKFVEGSYDLTALLTLAIPIFLFLAARGIYRDEKLVKSMDRLR